MFKEWLLDVAKRLLSMEVCSSFVNGRRMYFVLVILDLLYRIWIQLLAQDKSLHDISMLFFMLCLKPNIEHSSPEFEDLQLLRKFIPADYWKEIAKILVHFINESSPTDQEWLCVIPLVHIFARKVEPFATPAFLQKQIKWTDPSINLGLIKKNADVLSSWYVSIHNIHGEPYTVL